MFAYEPWRESRAIGGHRLIETGHVVRMEGRTDHGIMCEREIWRTAPRGFHQRLAGALPVVVIVAGLRRQEERHAQLHLLGELEFIVTLHRKKAGDVIHDEFERGLIVRFAGFARLRRSASRHRDSG